MRERADIDHVAVGPSGVVVVETKWATDPWPIGVAGPPRMVDRLNEVAAQVRRNAKDVERHFARASGGASI